MFYAFIATHVSFYWILLFDQFYVAFQLYLRSGNGKCSSYFNGWWHVHIFCGRPQLIGVWPRQN